MSEHEANTVAVILASKAMNHVEGGWPKDIDYSEAEHTIRWDTDEGLAWSTVQQSLHASLWHTYSARFLAERGCAWEWDAGTRRGVSSWCSGT